MSHLENLIFPNLKFNQKGYFDTHLIFQNNIKVFLVIKPKNIFLIIRRPVWISIWNKKSEDYTLDITALFKTC